MGHVDGCCHLVASALRRLEATTTTCSQNRHYTHLRAGSTVRGLIPIPALPLTFLSNLLVAIFRIISITKLDVPHDMTYNLSEAFVWMYV